MKSIALSGMRGRRRDAVYLVFVITLSLMFMTVATQLLSSVRETEKEQNFNVFGQWKAALLSATREEAEALRAGNKSLGSKIIESSMIKANGPLGVIGTMNDEFNQIGRFKMYEGRLPVKENEIALEQSQLGLFDEDIKVGDEFEVEFIVPLPTGTEKTYNEYFEEVLWPVAQAERGSITDEDIRNFRDILAGQDSESLNKLEMEGDEAITWELKRKFCNDLFLNFTMTELHYQKPDPIIYEDIRMDVSTEYRYIIPFSKGNKFDNETIMKNGLITSRNMTVIRTFKLTGIIQSYSIRWDTGNYSLPNAFVSEEGMKQQENAFKSMIERLNYNFDIPLDYNLFLTSDNADVKELFAEAAATIWPEHDANWSLMAETGTQSGVMKLRMNALAYPAGMGETENTLTEGVVLGIFLITVCAVLQILITQLKRRKKRIALLKAVGATNSQVAGLLLWECGFVLFVSLPAGVVLGGLLSFVAVQAYNAFVGGALSFAPDIGAVLLGMALCCASVFIGMAGPLAAALRVSPVQGIQETGRRKRGSVELKGVGCGSFSAVCRRRRAADRGKSALSLGLSTFTAVIALSALTLSFLSFREYNDKKYYEGTPDYVLQANQGLSPGIIMQRLESLNYIPGINSVNVLKKAERLYISFDNMEKSPSLNGFRAILPRDKLYEHFGGMRLERFGLNKGKLIDEEYTKGTYIANLYGVDIKAELCARIKDAVTEGNINEDRFMAGQEAVLLIPLYMEGPNYSDPPMDVNVPDKYKKEERMRALLKEHDVLSITTDKRRMDYFKREEEIKPGDTIHITVCHENLSGEQLNYNYREHDVKISGVIHYFPDDAIWPFSQFSEGYTLIGSYELVSAVYPKALGTMYDQHEAQDLSTMQELYYPTIYGQTWFAVYGNEQANREETDLSLLAFCRRNGYTLHNYKDMAREVFASALNNTVMICLLGLAASLIAGVILYNTEQSSVEQDRHRIGVLQALGVTQKELRSWKWKTGLLNGLVSLAIANAFVLCVMVFTSVMEAGGMDLSLGERVKDIFQYQFSLYPWAVHIGLCTAYLICTVLIHRVPIRLATRRSPVENILS